MRTENSIETKLLKLQLVPIFILPCTCNRVLSSLEGNDADVMPDVEGGSSHGVLDLIEGGGM